MTVAFDSESCLCPGNADVLVGLLLADEDVGAPRKPIDRHSTRFMQYAIIFPLALNSEPSYTCNTLHKTLNVSQFMSMDVTIENLIRVICEDQGTDQRIITPSSLLEDDLGITGDDGCELLQTVEKKFGISFTGPDGTIRGVFGLKEDEFLFHSEGYFDLGFIGLFFGGKKTKIKPITVAQLYEAVCVAKEKDMPKHRLQRMHAEP